MYKDPLLKVGEVFTAPSGRWFKVKKVTKTLITVDVERVVGRGEARTLQVNVREVPVEDFALFARPYPQRGAKKNG